MFLKLCQNDTVFIYSIFYRRGISVELLEVTKKLECIELVAKVAHLEGVTDRQQAVALLLIGEWAEEVNAGIKNHMKKPLSGGSLDRTSFQ